MRPILLVDLEREIGLADELALALEARYALRRIDREDGAAELGAGDGLGLVLLAADPRHAERAGSLALGLRRATPEVPLLLAAGRDRIGELLERVGPAVDDFQTAPFHRRELRLRIERWIERPGASDPTVERLTAKLGLMRLVGRSPRFVEAVEKVPAMADCNATVLISGETGTGKELFARAIHYLSGRSGKPFVALNCGAMPLDLIENELFGHERDAYTGASSSRDGLVNAAEGGTLMLDEIDALPAAAQVKLLRFLQEKEYRRLGSTRTVRADVRLIAATNSPVEEAVERGTLRRDLYYRLNVLPLWLPPLRERRDDVLLLARYFLTRHSSDLGRPVPALSPRTAEALLHYRWPGNVRELEHLMERVVVLAGSRRLIRPDDVELSDFGIDQPRPRTFKQAKAQAVARFERAYVEKLLAAHNGNITHAARAAAKNRRAFFELIRKHRVDAACFRRD